MKISGLIFVILAVVIYSCNQETEVKKEAISAEPEVAIIDTAMYLADGANISKAVFKSLSSNLQQAMASGGVDSAIQFCSVNAQPLTDSLSQYYQVSIKRTSHRIRNPKNAPTSEETAALDQYLAGAEKAMIREKEDGSVVFYAPIPTKGLCVVCHGEVGSSIAEKDYESILKAYPNDSATGFSVDDLRGMWSITFKPKS